MSSDHAARIANRRASGVSPTAEAPTREGPCRSLGIAAWGAVALTLLLLLCFFWQGPDIFYHLFLGRQVLATHSFQPPDHLLMHQASYRNIYWLFQAGVALCWAAGGIWAGTLFFLVAWVAVVAVWARSAGLRLRSAFGPAFTLAAVLLFQTRFEPRPETFSYLFLILQVGWLSVWRFGEPGVPRRMALFGATEVLWTNIHGYFVFGPALVALRLLAALIEKEERGAVRELALLVAVTLAATFVSPLGPGAWGFAITLGRFFREMRSTITEFLPPTGRFLKLWTVKLFWIAWAGTLIALVALVLRRRTGIFAAALAAAGLALSAAALRNAPLLLLLSAPLYKAVAQPDTRPSRSRQVPGATSRSRPVPAWRKLLGPSRTAPAATLLAGTLLAGVALSAWTVAGGFHRSLMSDTSFGVGLSDQAYPLGFVRHVREAPWSGRLFNDAADGGYLELALPQVQPVMDSRYVEAGPVREYFAALADPAAFRDLDARLRFDGLLLRVIDSGALVQSLLRDPAWKLEWGDLHRAFFTKRTAEERMAAAAGFSSTDPTSAVSFYNGQDLSRNINGRPAMQWATLLVQSRDRAGFLRLLDQLMAARQVPSYIVQWALDWGLSTGDREMIARAEALAPKILAYVPENRRVVERLLRAAQARGSGGMGR